MGVLSTGGESRKAGNARAGGRTGVVGPSAEDALPLDGPLALKLRLVVVLVVVVELKDESETNIDADETMDAEDGEGRRNELDRVDALLWALPSEALVLFAWRRVGLAFLPIVAG